MQARVSPILLIGISLSAGVGCGKSPESVAPAGSCGIGHARVVSENAIDARTTDLVIDSPALGENVPVRLIFPADHATSPGRTLPVLYLLHGAEVLAPKNPPYTSYSKWSTETDVEALTASTDVLVVMPEGGNVGWYSDWYNDGAGGPPKWETFHLCELRGILERDYHAGKERAIAGLSMGGMGATSYAARHPGMFRAVASFSGMLGTEKFWAGVQITLTAQGFGATQLWGSGNPNDPDNRLDLWAEHDPYALADKLVKIPVFVSSGNGDPGPLDTTKTSPDLTEQSVYQTAQDFSKKLGDLGGQVTTDFYGAGTHSWPYWQQELHRAFPMLIQAIGAK